MKSWIEYWGGFHFILSALHHRIYYRSTCSTTCEAVVTVMLKLIIQSHM